MKAKNEPEETVRDGSGCASGLRNSQLSTRNSQLLRLIGVDVTRAADAAGGSCLDFIASTGAVDRYHEIIEPAGWQLERYRSNPVFQNAHKYGDIIFTLGRALITEVRDLGDGRKGLFQRIEFATEVNPMAKIAHGLYAGGFLKAVSVGFIPVRWEDGTEKSAFRRRYLEQELLEVSAVAVPANPEALALGLREGAVTRQDLKEAIELLGVAAAGGRKDSLYYARALHALVAGSKLKAEKQK